MEIGTVRCLERPKLAVFDRWDTLSLIGPEESTRDMAGPKRGECLLVDVVQMIELGVYLQVGR